MGFVFQLNLDSFEGECLVQYLKASPQPAAMELLLLFYLQRSNFREAIHLVDTLQKTAPTKQALSLSTALIDNYKLIFPSSSLKIPQRKQLMPLYLLHIHIHITLTHPPSLTLHSQSQYDSQHHS
jgi:hypothetical protein